MNDADITNFAPTRTICLNWDELSTMTMLMKKKQLADYRMEGCGLQTDHRTRPQQSHRLFDCGVGSFGKTNTDKLFSPESRLLLVPGVARVLQHNTRHNTITRKRR